MKSPRYWALQHYLNLWIISCQLCRNEKPEILGIATGVGVTGLGVGLGVEMKSPGYWALQHRYNGKLCFCLFVEMKSLK